MGYEGAECRDYRLHRQQIEIGSIAAVAQEQDHCRCSLEGKLAPAVRWERDREGP